MQQIVNAAPTPGEGDRVQRMISALVTAGIDGGYVASPRLARVHWQAAGRPLPASQATVAGESPLWVDPAEIPSDDDIGQLGRALACGRHGDRDELMAETAAYSGLRWGELTALTVPRVDAAARCLSNGCRICALAERLCRAACMFIVACPTEGCSGRTAGGGSWCLAGGRWQPWRSRPRSRRDRGRAWQADPPRRY